MHSARLAKAHGLYNLLSGVWPLVHMRSFEAVLGPKTDRWLVRTVAGLLVTNGVAQIRAARDPKRLDQVKPTAMGTAVTLGTIDVVYACSGRISPIYLLDAVVELAWTLLWARSGRRQRRTGR